MPLQNRVTPFGEIVALEARGTMMGNRGRLHDDHRAHRPVHAGAPLARVRARVPRTQAQGDAARILHRALLPRRGDGAERRTPSVRGVQIAATIAVSARSGKRSSADPRRPERSTRGSTPNVATATSNARIVHASPACPTERSLRSAATHGSCRATRSSRGLRAVTRGAASARGTATSTCSPHVRSSPSLPPAISRDCPCECWERAASGIGPRAPRSSTSCRHRVRRRG